MSQRKSCVWYTTSQVADILGRSDRFVRDRVKSGELEAMANKGKQRTSYKISAEALASYAIATQSGDKKLLENVLTKIDQVGLENIYESVSMLLQKRANPNWEILPRCERMHQPAVELEARRLEEEFIYQDPQVYQNYQNNPLNFTSTLINKTTGQAEAHFGVEVSSVEYFEALCKGVASDDYQPPWEPGQIPIFYVDVLIIDDPLCAPYLFRHMASQLNEFMRENRLKVEACFTIASSAESVALVQKYGFYEVGRYEDGDYPIVLNRNIREGRLGRFFKL